MEISRTRRDWNSLLLAILLLIGMGCALIFSAIMAFLAISNFSDQPFEKIISFLMLAGGALFTASLLIPGIYLNFARFFNQYPAQFPVIQNTHWVFSPFIITIWLICLMAGNFMINWHGIALLSLPIFNILGVTLPVVFYLSISLRNLALPGSRRLWSLFGANLLLAPTLAFIFEGILVALLIFLLIIYSRFDPSLHELLGNISKLIIRNTLSQEQASHYVSQLILSPAVTLLLLGVFSVGVPVIEECAKILVIIPLLHKTGNPVDGFVLGVFCGAAFAMMENLGFASAGSVDWAATVLTRSTSALPHIFNSGLLGYALVAASKNHNLGKLLVSFLAAIAIHGTWNAISLGLAFNSLADGTSNVPFIFQNTYPWLAGWCLLGAGLFFGLVTFNRRFCKELSEEVEKKPEV